MLHLSGSYIGLTNTGASSAAMEQGKIQSFNTLFSKGSEVSIQYRANNDILKDIKQSSTIMFVFGLNGTKLYEKKITDTNGLFHGTWDGKDQSGNEVGPGIYIIQLKNDYFTKITRVIYK